VLARCNQDNTEVESDTNRDKPSIIAVMAEEYQPEDWVSRYNSALTELEQAKMLSRITSAQDAIVDRLEKLRMMPDLHPEERRAIEHAIRTLGILEQQHARFDAEEERRSLDLSLEKLRSVGDTIQRCLSVPDHPNPPNKNYVDAFVTPSAPCSQRERYCTDGGLHRQVEWGHP
jgi:hypothetical protein